MSSVLNPHDVLKRKAVLAILSLTSIGGTAATILHRLQPDSHIINLSVPPLLAITSLVLLILLLRKPESLPQVTNIGLFGGLLFILIPGWFFTLEAFSSPSTKLVENLPPISSPLFLFTIILLIFLRPERLMNAAIVSWVATAAPILTYLFLHLAELYSPRGLDLFISLGPSMGTQIALVLFYARLQKIVDRLYAERLQYYTQIIERQSIRQQAIEQTFTQIHNGPLQTLALLQRNIQREQIPSQEILQQLNKLNTEIRAVGHSLTDKQNPETKLVPELADLELTSSEHTLRLGEGTCIDLNLPLHNLLHEVYSLTLSRNLPYFKTIQVKVRNFAPIIQPSFTLDMKRDVCLWLEEALCNIGKHAQGATRILVTGQQQEDCYILLVQDNGCGLKSGQEQQGTKHSTILADKLGGKFRRESLPTGGVLCELSWPVT